MFFRLPLACQSSKTIPFCFTQNSVSEILLWCRGTDTRLSFSKDSLACLKLWCSGQEEGAGRMGTDYHRRMGLDGWRGAWGAQDMRPLPPPQKCHLGALLTLSPRHLKNRQQEARLSLNPWDCVTSALCKELTCHQPPSSSFHQEARLVTRRRLETDITSFLTQLYFL